MKPFRTKHARRPIEVARDEYGVPHIAAPTRADCLYGLGYMHACDRPTQVLFARTVASGRSAELIADKPELVETDRFFRRAGLYLSLADEARALDEPTAALIAAYCDGVNDGLAQSGRSLPMLATGYVPEPWDPQAVLLVGNLLNYNGLVVSQQQNERLLVELIQSGVDQELLRELFDPLLNQADFAQIEQIHVSNRLSDEAMQLIADLPRLVGSNAWAVAPARSATASALLASDPHLEVNRLPAIWYEAVLRWADDYVLGASLPGCPLFASARTRRLAWGVTYLKADTSDYFIEDCRPSEPGGWQYRRGDAWFDFQSRTELIQRKFGAAESLRVWFNDQGTMVDEPRKAGFHLSSAWTGAYEGVGRSLATWLGVVECAGVADAMQRVRDCPQPTLVWAFADSAGHIGKQACGWVPRRGGQQSGLLPIPAWDPAHHWQGWIPADELPSEFDPPRGFVTTANESPDPIGVARLVSQPVHDYRKRRIDEVLASWPQATLADMQRLQYDVISLQARDLLNVFLPCLDPGTVRDRLAAWDCGYGPESREATLFTRLYRNVLVKIFGQNTRRRGGLGWRRMVYLSTRAGYSMMVVTCLDRLLQRDDSLWWRDRDKRELIRQAGEKLALAPDEPWAVTNAFRFTNRFFESQFVGRALGFHTGELPMRGCHATPFQGHLLRVATRETTFAPSYHFVADLAQPEAYTNLPGGPSESWLSRWYKSDIARWLDGTYKPLRPD